MLPNSIFMAKAKQNLNLKIQILAGKEAKTFFERFLKISHLYVMPLGHFDHQNTSIAELRLVHCTMYSK